MIRRVLVAGLIAALVAAAWVAPVPEPPAQEVATATTFEGPVTASTFSNCAWAVADDARETLFGIVSLHDVDAQLTFPVAGEIRETFPESLPGPGASALPLANILALGVAPAVVEFSDGPAAAGVVVVGEGMLAADLCPSSASKVWVLPGGSTVREQQLTLQLFNPFPEDARVTVEVVSEEGFEPSPDLEGISVAGRGWKAVELGEILPFRQMLSVTLQTEQGRVIPAMVQSNGDDQAVWTDVGRSEVWEFPLVTAGQLDPHLAVANDGALEVTYTLDVFTADGLLEGAGEGVIPANGQIRTPLAGLAEGTFGVRLRADGPVSAVVIGEADNRIAATTGAPLTASQWMLPGAGADSGATYSLWFMNSGVEQITVTYQLLDAGGTVESPGKLAIPPGSIRSLALDTVGIASVIAESTGPFSVAWSAEALGAIAYSSGVPVGE